MSEARDVRIYRSLPRAKRLLSIASVLSATLALLFASLVVDAARARSITDPAAIGYAAISLFLILVAAASAHIAVRTVRTDPEGITLIVGPRNRRILWRDVRQAGVGRFSLILNLAADRSARVFLPAEGFGPPERRYKARNRLLADIYQRIGEEIVAYGWLDRPITARERRNLQERAVVVARDVVEYPQPQHRFELLWDIWTRGGDDPVFIDLMNTWEESWAGSDSPEEMMRSFARQILEAWGL